MVDGPALGGPWYGFHCLSAREISSPLNFGEVAFPISRLGGIQILPAPPSPAKPSSSSFLPALKNPIAKTPKLGGKKEVALFGRDSPPPWQERPRSLWGTSRHRNPVRGEQPLGDCGIRGSPVRASWVPWKDKIYIDQVQRSKRIVSFHVEPQALGLQSLTLKDKGTNLENRQREDSFWEGCNWRREISV